jgi:hypothetical protein
VIAAESSSQCRSLLTDSLTLELFGAFEAPPRGRSDHREAA